jgi:hypothetical protein
VPNKKNPHIIDANWFVKTLIVDFLAIFNTTRIKATFYFSYCGINYGSIGPYKSHSDDIDGVQH